MGRVTTCVLALDLLDRTRDFWVHRIHAVLSQIELHLVTFPGTGRGALPKPKALLINLTQLTMQALRKKCENAQCCHKRQCPSCQTRHFVRSARLLKMLACREAKENLIRSIFLRFSCGWRTERKE